mmetsp:Transcript_7366/g.17937  ORF Transcript_7366/g.17937 Transcript_7366/m.17937 type:complete len:409 (-) Transcript_7366:156-1382(-)
MLPLAWRALHPARPAHARTVRSPLSLSPRPPRVRRGRARRAKAAPLPPRAVTARAAARAPALTPSIRADQRGSRRSRLRVGDARMRQKQRLRRVRVECVRVRPQLALWRRAAAKRARAPWRGRRVPRQTRAGEAKARGCPLCLPPLRSSARSGRAHPSPQPPCPRRQRRGVHGVSRCPRAQRPTATPTHRGEACVRVLQTKRTNFPPPRRRANGAGGWRVYRGRAASVHPRAAGPYPLLQPARPKPRDRSACSGLRAPRRPQRPRAGALFRESHGRRRRPIACPTERPQPGLQLQPAARLPRLLPRPRRAAAAESIAPRLVCVCAREQQLRLAQRRRRWQRVRWRRGMCPAATRSPHLHPHCLRERVCGSRGVTLPAPPCPPALRPPCPPKAGAPSPPSLAVSPAWRR